MPLGLFIASAYLVLGIATFYLGPRIGPNPIFGVRTSVTLEHRDVWDAANRIGGLMLAGMGLVLFALLGLFAAAGIAGDDLRGPILGYVLLTVAVLGVWAITYPPRVRDRRR